jgi:ornithine carbamoyltransferase
VLVNGTSEDPASKAFSATGLVFDNDLSVQDCRQLLETAEKIRENQEQYRQSLTGRILVLLFEKPSLRTRVTFEVAMKSLGGDSLFMDLRGEKIGQREPVADVARNLDRWVQAIVARTFEHETVVQLAHWARIPVVNALSDRFHPCQALADMLTLKDIFGELEGIRLAYVGDGNNVACSLLLTGAKLGLQVEIATPAGYEPDTEIVRMATEIADQTGSRVSVGNDPVAAVKNAHAVYTDAWASMGSEHEAELRRERFQPFRITEELFARARSEAVFLHCLPAHRDEEVAAEVLESPRSHVFDQAENRLHVQKALLYLLLAD